jgi:hypothetical protein
MVVGRRSGLDGRLIGGILGGGRGRIGAPWLARLLGIGFGPMP